MTGGAVRERVELPAVPGLGGLYARAAAGSVRRGVRSRAGRAGHAGRSGRAGRAAGPAGRLPDVEHVVRGVTADADHLTAYQHLVGEPAVDAMPAGFVHVLAFPVATALMSRRDFPLPLVGLVHLANVVEQRRPVMLGERLTVRAHAEALRAHRKGTQVDLVTEVRADDDDAVAWRGVSTYLAKGVRLDDVDDDETARETPEQPAPVRPTFVPPDPTGRWSLPADAGRRYAAVSGDRNPIHLSALTARALGFPRAIAHGMDTAARALAAVGAARGEAFTWTVDFATPVLLPGTVAVRVAARADGHGFEYAGWNPRSGAPHLTGTVETR